MLHGAAAKRATIHKGNRRARPRDLGWVSQFVKGCRTPAAAGRRDLCDPKETLWAPWRRRHQFCPVRNEKSQFLNERIAALS